METKIGKAGNIGNLIAFQPSTRDVRKCKHLHIVYLLYMQLVLKGNIAKPVNVLRLVCRIKREQMSKQSKHNNCTYLNQ